jgi:hypothetical protein
MPNNTPPEIPYLDTQATDEALEAFIFKSSIYTSLVVPRKLSPKEVARFLIARIEKDSKLRVLLQAEKVIDFYDIYEIVPKFRQFLDRRESSAEDVRRSIVFARVIAILGNGEDLNLAAEYYHHLVQRADSVSEFEDLVLLYESLEGSGANSAVLRQKVEAKMLLLKPVNAGGPQPPPPEFYKLREISQLKLPRAEQARKLKSKILSIADRNQRIDEEIQMYLTIQSGYSEYLQPWATRRIRRETWAPQPAQQVVRPEKAPLNEDVQKAFQRTLEKLKELPDLPDEIKEFAKVRSLRAILFFDGKLSAEETEFLRLYKGEQLDVLANEGIMLP